MRIDPDPTLTPARVPAPRIRVVPDGGDGPEHAGWMP